MSTGKLGCEEVIERLFDYLDRELGAKQAEACPLRAPEARVPGLGRSP